MTIGKRAFDATFFGGNFADLFAIPDITMNNTEADAATDTLKTEYAI